MLKILNVVGARPNFMKMAPILAEQRRRSAEVAPLLVHTGQHYDESMSGAFFRDLDMPAPDIHLACGGGSHAEQTARVMLAIEPVLAEHKPDWLVVVGDVNSTLACALVASKLSIRIAHVEAGLRSFDRSMPEEINRVLTDRISDLLLTPSADADENLLREGLDPHRIVRVGNVMIDTLHRQLARARATNVLEALGLQPHTYAVATLHRPANVDSIEPLQQLLSALDTLSRDLPVVFPAHPRTQARMREYGLAPATGVRLLDPLGYSEFLQLWSQSRLVLTDSGGLQEETTALRIPCLTLRDTTERPITVREGSNQVVGTDPARIVSAAKAVLAGGRAASARIPALWDGHAAERIVQALVTTATSRRTRIASAPGSR